MKNTAYRKNKIITFRIPEKMFYEYKRFCEKNYLSVSKRIRKYIEMDLNIWKNNNK